MTTTNRPTAPEAARLIAAVYATETGGAGCCLHVQCDDGNLGNEFFTDESRESIDPSHAACLAAFDCLRVMKQTGRRRACKIWRDLPGAEEAWERALLRWRTT